MKHPKEVDWIAWGLHLIAGGVAGGVFGVLVLGVLLKPRRFGLYVTELAPVVYLVAGLAMIGAGIASSYGDAFWLRNSYRVIPPDRLQQNLLSRVLSLGIGVLGFGLLLLSLSMPWYQKS